MPDQGAPVGHHDATASSSSNDTPTVPHHPGYGDSTIPSSTPNALYAGFLPPQAAAHMSSQPVYAPMAGYAIQQNAPWMPAPQHLGPANNPGIQHQHQHQHQHQQRQHQQPHQHQQENRPAGLAPTNWLSHFSAHIPAGPSTPSSYMMPPGFGTYTAPPLAGTPAMQLAQEQAMQHSYSFLSPDQQMLSMEAALHTQNQNQNQHQHQHQHQPMQAMMPQHAMDSLDSGPLPSSTATSPWPAAHDPFLYYAPFGFGDARTPSAAYTQAMDALPSIPNVPFAEAAPQPMYLSNNMMAANDNIAIMGQPPMQPYPGPATTSFTHSIDDDLPNEARRKFVRTNSGARGLFANRSSSVDVHGCATATPMTTALSDTPEHNPSPLVSSEAHMADVASASAVGVNTAGDDADAMCISPLRKRSLSAACGEDRCDTAGAREPALVKTLATVCENSPFASDAATTTHPDAAEAALARASKQANKEPHHAPVPQPGAARQEMQFVHMDAAEILMSSSSMSPDDNESGAPIKSVKFRPAGNAPIKVRKWSTIVHPPPPESGYGSMLREVDFDHSASNVFLQHQASPVAPSSVTAKFMAAPPSMGKGKAKQDDTGSPSIQPVRTLNWRPSDDRISARSTASAATPSKTAAARTARLEEKKKAVAVAVAAEEAKTAQTVDTPLPDADTDGDSDSNTVEPMSVAKALAELSTKRGRPALTSRIARPKQVRRRTEDTVSKPDAKAAKATKQVKSAAKPASGIAVPKG